MQINKSKKLLYILLLAALSFTSCDGQTRAEQQGPQAAVAQLSFTSKNQKLTKTQGANQYQNIYCSLQDKAGNLWFGTTGEGVYSYDGKVFTQFTQKDGLSSNTVWSMLEDAAGNIWFGTDNGISRYDGRAISKVITSTAYTGGLGLPVVPSGKNEVWSMMQDKSGIIWFGTTKDLYCYDGKTFNRFLDKHVLLNSQHLKLTWIQCLLQDSTGTIWMGSGPLAQEGVIRFDGKSLTHSKPNGDGWIRYILKDKNGNTWFGGRLHGVFRYDGQSFKTFTEKANSGAPILEDKKGNLWFTGEERLNGIESVNGIWRYDGKSFTNFSEKDGMGKYFAWSILEDKSGNIWIGTRNCGLYRYDGNTFTTFSE